MRIVNFTYESMNRQYTKDIEPDIVGVDPRSGKRVAHYKVHCPKTGRFIACFDVIGEQFPLATKKSTRHPKKKLAKSVESS